jgi:hypothetical protein
MMMLLIALSKLAFVSLHLTFVSLHLTFVSQPSISRLKIVVEEGHHAFNSS